MELLWALESIRTPFLDAAFSLITRLGEEMLLILVFCVFFWCINKRMAYVMGVSFFLSALVVQGMKIIFQVPRPWVYDPSFNTVQGAIREATGYAFPSGHTQNAAAYLGGLGAQVKNKIIKIILFALVILVAFSRMYLGVHYLLDVIVSLAITFLIIWLAVKFVTDEPVSRKREIMLSLIIALFAVVVIAIVAVLYNTGTAPSQLRDSIIDAGAALGFALGMYVERNYIRFSVAAKNIPIQILKFVLGIGGTIAIQEGVRLAGTSLLVDGIRYFLMVTWITLVFPLIIKRFFARNMS